MTLLQGCPSDTTLVATSIAGVYLPGFCSRREFRSRPFSSYHHHPLSITITRKDFCSFFFLFFFALFGFKIIFRWSVKTKTKRDFQVLLDFVRWVNMNYIQAFMLALLKKESYMHLQAQHEEQEQENVTTLHLLHAA